MSLLAPWSAIDQPVPWVDVLLIVVAGLIGTFGHFLFILAYQRAGAAALTPFTYVQLIWATLLGWLFFGRLPDAWATAGMVVIAGSGLAVVLRERQQAKAVALGPAPID
jgi:drug/metabolite transporter (DMT)-like permease